MICLLNLLPCCARLHCHDQFFRGDVLFVLALLQEVLEGPDADATEDLVLPLAVLIKEIHNRGAEMDP